MAKMPLLSRDILRIPDPVFKRHTYATVVFASSTFLVEFALCIQLLSHKPPRPLQDSS